MAKYYGAIGFAQTIETVPGVWEESITEKKYYGNVNRNNKRWQNTDNLNDDIVINNEISIIADQFACEHSSNMRYLTWMGTKWRITNISAQYPRLILTIGGVYNGQQT